MPIAGQKPTTPPPQTQQLPNVQPVDYRSNIVSEAIQPAASLLSYIEGAPWTVTYYGQILGQHNELKELDPTIPDTYQSYSKINAFEIRVSSGLTSSFDTDTSISTYSGNGIIYPFIVPNVCDYFIADAGDVRKAIFKINNVERKSIHRDSVHYVEYELIGYVENKADLFNALENRSVKTYWFDKDRLLENNNPLLREDTYNSLKILSEEYYSMSKYYFKNFFSNKYNTLVVPGQSGAIYDPYLTDFVMKIVGMSDAPELARIRAPAIGNDPIAQQPQLWTMLLERNFSQLRDIRDIMTFVARFCFSKNPYLQSFFFSGLDYIAYPKNPDLTITGSEYHVLPEHPNEFYVIPRVIKDMGSIRTNEYIAANKTFKLIPTLDLNTAYVLSRDFYDQTENMSIIEILVKDYLKKQTIDNNKLIALCNAFYDWERLEQFYYGPIVIMLIKSALVESY